MNVHYNSETGQIISYGWGADHGDGFEISHLDGCKVLIVDSQDIDPAKQRIDPVALAIVAKTEADPEPDRIIDVLVLVRFELADTDKFVLPDFPVSDADRAAWVVYRKALRDASKDDKTAVAMIGAIPVRPDGVDAVAYLRKLAP